MGLCFPQTGFGSPADIIYGWSCRHLEQHESSLEFCDQQVGKHCPCVSDHTAWGLDEAGHGLGSGVQ